MIREILSPIITVILLMLGNGFFLSFTSLKLNDVGAGESAIGLVHAAYYLGLLFGAAKAEGIINRVGHIRAYAAYSALGTVCMMIQGIVVIPSVWILTRLAMGFCLAVYYVVIESWFLWKATAKTRGIILSIYMIILYSSQGVSQFILELIDLSGPNPFFLAGLLSSLSAVPLTLTKRKSPHFEELSGISLGTLFQKSHFGFVGCLISGVILSSIYSFAPLFALSNGMIVSVVMGTCIFGGVFLQWPIGKASDLFDRRRVLFFVAVSTVLISFLTVIAVKHDTWVYLLLFLIGGVGFSLYPLSITEVCDRLQPKDITKATGMLLLAYGIGSVIGPLIAPLVIHESPERGLFIFILLNSLILVGMGIRSFFFSKPVPEELQAEFVPLPRITPVAYELDPRVED